MNDKIFSQRDNNLASRGNLEYYPNQARCSDRTVPPGVNAALPFPFTCKEKNMSKTVVSSDNAPAGPYSPGIQTGNMVFLSGQLGIDPATGKMPEGVEAQAKQSLANVEALLTAAGATFADVVKTTVYLADIADFAAVNEIYASKFEAPFPARSAFQVAALPAGGLVEIEVVAAL